MGKGSKSRRSRALKRYWRDVKAVQKQEGVSLAAARQLLRATRKGPKRKRRSRKEALRLVSRITVIADFVQKGELPFFFNVEFEWRDELDPKIKPTIGNSGSYTIDVRWRFDDPEASSGQSSSTDSLGLSMQQDLDSWWHSFNSVLRGYLERRYEGDQSPEGEFLVERILFSYE